MADEAKQRKDVIPKILLQASAYATKHTFGLKLAVVHTTDISRHPRSVPVWCRYLLATDANLSAGEEDVSITGVRL